MMRKWLLLISVLAASVLLTAGCEEKLPRDLLKGWTLLGSIGWNGFANTGIPPKKPIDKAIMDDVRDFIQKLPTYHDSLGERHEGDDVMGMSFFEDGTGQHAVCIPVLSNGTSWIYVIFYDKTNTRTRVVKGVVGHYAC